MGHETDCCYRCYQIRRQIRSYRKGHQISYEGWQKINRLLNIGSKSSTLGRLWNPLPARTGTANVKLTVARDDLPSMNEHTKAAVDFSIGQIFYVAPCPSPQKTSWSS